jgi:organic hydroperoxide reductase OsmC/OhrA
MLGTLSGGLEARGITLSADQIRGEASGELELIDRLPLLKRIHVHYWLTIPGGTRETVDRLLAKHGDKCPTAASLQGAIEVTWSADITEDTG